jgi:hypothetical protein
LPPLARRRFEPARDAPARPSDQRERVVSAGSTFLFETAIAEAVPNTLRTRAKASAWLIACGGRQRNITTSGRPYGNSAMARTRTAGSAETMPPRRAADRFAAPPRCRRTTCVSLPSRP